MNRFTIVCSFFLAIFLAGVLFATAAGPVDSPSGSTEGKDKKTSRGVKRDDIDRGYVAGKGVGKSKQKSGHNDPK